MCVWLLRRLTEVFPETVACIHDDDGEFLMIESSEALPKWARPETVEGRVFLSNGLVHIFPPPSTPAELRLFPLRLTPDHVFSALRKRSYREDMDGSNDNSSVTIREFVVEEANDKITKRLESFDTVWNRFHLHHHRARVTLPLRVAVAFSLFPHLVSAACASLETRDSQDMAAAARMSRLLPDSQVVTTTLTLPRLLYARLLHLVFHAPRSYPRKGSEDDGTAYELGLKLACGLEMAYQKSVQCSQRHPCLCDESVVWDAFRQALELRGYFDVSGEISFTLLTTAANVLFRYLIVRFDTESRPAPEYPLAKSLDSAFLSLTESGLRDAAGRCSRWGGYNDDNSTPTVDSDEWMNLVPEQLENFLHSKYSVETQHSKSGRDHAVGQDKSAGENLEQMVASLRKFVNASSGIDGVEVGACLPMDADDVDLDVDKLTSLLRGVVSTGSLAAESDESGSPSMSDEEGAPSERGGEESTDDGAMKEELFAKLKGGESQSEVDVDFTVVSSLLESFRLQYGDAGPVSNILGTLGVTLPPISPNSSAS